MEAHGHVELSLLDVGVPLNAVLPCMLAVGLLLGRFVLFWFVLLSLLFMLWPFLKKGAQLRGKRFWFSLVREKSGVASGSPRRASGHPLFVGVREWPLAFLTPKKLRPPVVEI